MPEPPPMLAIPRSGKDPRVYVGLTGLSGAGKDTVGKLMADLARAHQVHVRCYNLSDEIRDELVRRGQVGDAASRSTLIAVGNELRTTFGGGVLAERIIAKERVYIAENGGPDLVIAAGIRNPEEVKAFRNEWGHPHTFIMVAVESFSEIRAIRLASRSQYREDAILSREVEQADQAIGIDACAQMSDWHIRNDGGVEQLQAGVYDFFARRIAPVLGIAIPNT
jgi:dephospho-CoA kinase